MGFPTLPPLRFTTGGLFTFCTSTHVAHFIIGFIFRFTTGGEST